MRKNHYRGSESLLSQSPLTCLYIHSLTHSFPPTDTLLFLTERKKRERLIMKRMNECVCLCVSGKAILFLIHSKHSNIRIRLDPELEAAWTSSGEASLFCPARVYLFFILSETLHQCGLLSSDPIRQQVELCKKPRIRGRSWLELESSVLPIMMISLARREEKLAACFVRQCLVRIGKGKRKAIGW